MSKLGDLTSIVRIAIKDFFFEWRLSICFVLALAAVMTPLLVLFGLKFGLSVTITQRLVNDPRNVEMLPVGSGHYSQQWFKDMAERKDVGFIVPRTRSIAASIFIRNKNVAGTQLIPAELIPTKAGDPLLNKRVVIPEDGFLVVLSQSAARKIKAETGQTIEGSLTRTMDGQRQRVTVPLIVIDVTPESTFQRPALFAHLDLVLAAEDYRDGFAVPAYGWEGKQRPNERQEFASYRLYAKSIYNVAGLRDLMQSQGLDVRTKAAEIEQMIKLSHNLSFLFWLVALIGSGGYGLSLGSSLWANVDRKRRDLSVLRLLGYSSLAIMGFPIIQAMLIGVAGLGLASSVYLVVERVLNKLFATSLEAGEMICQLMMQHFVIALVATLGIGMLAATLAAYRITRIEPSEELRDV